MKTQDLIDRLASDPTERWHFDRAFRWAIFVAILIAGAIFSIWIQVRPDFFHATQTIRFQIKFVVTLTTTFAAIGFARRALQPGQRLDGWVLAPFMGPILLSAAVIFELCSTPSSIWIARLIGANSVTCLTLIPLMASGPLICIILAFRRGAPAHPGAAGVLAGLIASSIAATFYAARCTDDSPLFVAIWYPLASALVMAAGYVLGLRFLRW